jgi:hypothetical protein
MKSEAPYWDWCDLCQRRIVMCGKCGNNCCNGGHGTLKDGSECDACNAAYEMQEKGELSLKTKKPPAN